MTKQQVLTAEKLYLRGWSLRDLALCYGVSHITVRYHLSKRLNLRGRGRPCQKAA